MTPEDLRHLRTDHDPFLLFTDGEIIIGLLAAIVLGFALGKVFNV